MNGRTEYWVIAHAEGCSNGTCPTVYAADHLGDDVLVQGYIPTAEVAEQLGIPAGEAVVRVPRSILTKLKESSAG